MRKFKFRLQGLENIRGMELDSMRQEYTLQQEELRNSEQELLHTRDGLNAAYNELAELRCQGMEPMIVLSLESYTQVLKSQLNACHKRVAGQRQALAAARERLTEKHKEKKVLEKFRERQHSRHSQYVERELQKELDETASNAHQQNH